MHSRLLSAWPAQVTYDHAYADYDPIDGHLVLEGARSAVPNATQCVETYGACVVPPCHEEHAGRSPVPLILVRLLYTRRHVLPAEPVPARQTCQGYRIHVARGSRYRSSCVEEWHQVRPGRQPMFLHCHDLRPFYHGVCQFLQRVWSQLLLV